MMTLVALKDVHDEEYPKRKLFRKGQEYAVVDTCEHCYVTYDDWGFREYIGMGTAFQIEHFKIAQ